ncbi:olfactory receptor 1496-like [Bombina bombina]|uniref:olfactory receptor 1496-like n=1 Tax=Bombina bombina TaxID=8345 RepID=UPI00235A9793|nr:olfactory receptor 1496-like [Bombina bombina]
MQNRVTSTARHSYENQMENQTSFKELYILGFSNKAEKQPFIFIFYFLIYLVGVLGNLVIIVIVYIDTHLHTTMYIFLGNLSFIDICYTTVTLPKFMDILLSGKNSVSFMQCITQMYFFIFIGSTELILLSCMAYDRYVAICFPLHYHCIMNKRKCLQILVATWMYGCGNSCFVTGFASALNICHSNRIQNFYCGLNALTKISCPDIGFYFMFYAETFFIVLFPFFIILISYFKIIQSILRIKSSYGRKKTFSTCTSHLTVITIFYGTILCIYARPPEDHKSQSDHIFSILYAAVTPMLNPIIYSLRNEEVKRALLRHLKRATK